MMLRMVDLNTDSTRNLLGAIPLFEGLSQSDLNWLGARAHRRVFSTGANIITAEQPGEAVYIILHGTVKIHVEQMDGRDVVLAILGAGDTLGEMSLIDSAGRSASAITLEGSVAPVPGGISKPGADSLGAGAAGERTHPGPGDDGCQRAGGASTAGLCR